MMGNVWEWNETLSAALRGWRGGSYGDTLVSTLGSSYRIGYDPSIELNLTGFRVAVVPEPATIAILAFGTLLMRKKRS
ncbi:MAG: PEP-CTERM sorting domain-containing protein [Planctomycetes bacterium]|nr:PEP-CTERM sorting domain-containing protein [Planctomycetota bacterium]